MSQDLKKNEKNEAPKQGKPWAIAGRYQTYNEATTIKGQLEDAVAQDNTSGKQYKIHRMRDPECFVVKTRIHPDFQEKENKKPKAKKEKSTENTKRSGKTRRTKKDDKKR